MVYYPYVVYLYCWNAKLVWDVMPTLQAISMIVTGITIFLMLILNYWWYYLILRGVKKMLFGGSKDTDE
jgi:hypothetical protein